ncbi:MAG: hypothetical protein ACKPBB_21840 [Sphaerospermopsis kisseleviana]
MKRLFSECFARTGVRSSRSRESVVRLRSPTGVRSRELDIK